MATWGGKQEGAGRPAGKLTLRTRQLREIMADKHCSPLEIMLKIMWESMGLDENGVPIKGERTLDVGLALDAAKAAAPYIHAKLANIELTGAAGGPIQVQSLNLHALAELPDDALANLLAEEVSTPPAVQDQRESEGDRPGNLKKVG